MLHLQEDDLLLIKEILQKHLPHRKVYAFGSRVTNQVKPHSDLDLCVMGAVPLSLSDYTELHHAFSESDLPIRIDIVDWPSLTPTFQRSIKTKGMQRIV